PRRSAHARAAAPPPAAGDADQHGSALRHLRRVLLRLWRLPPLGPRAALARRAPPVDQHELPALHPPRALEPAQADAHRLLLQALGSARQERVHRAARVLPLCELLHRPRRADPRGVRGDREAGLFAAALALVLAPRRQEGRRARGALTSSL